MWYKRAGRVQKLEFVEQPVNSTYVLLGPKGEKLVTDEYRNAFYFDVTSTVNYGNAYQIDIVIENATKACPTLIISMIIQHKQLGGLVYQNYWYFNDEMTAYEVYYEIITRTIKVRDIIETNRLNTVMTKPMIWHALHDIKGELEKPRKYTINYLRQTHNMDENKGLLMNNMVFLKPDKKIRTDQCEKMRTNKEITKNFISKGKTRNDLFGEDQI